MKHAYQQRRPQVKDLTQAQRDLLRQLPIVFEFDKVQPHPTLIATFNELRRMGKCTMHWSEVTRNRPHTALLAAMLEAVLKKQPNIQLPEAHLTTRVRVLTVRHHTQIDPEKARLDAINARAGEIRNQRGKRARKQAAQSKIVKTLEPA